MTVFLTPDQKPFFAGTYFPPSDRWGRPGFPDPPEETRGVLGQGSHAGVVAQAANLTARLRDGSHGSLPRPRSAKPNSIIAVTQFAEDFDAKLGGFGGAPKFPPATGLSLLLHCYHRTQDPHTLTMVRTTLDAMAAGGIYDHIGGGFARYSTDDRWLVPHFEKDALRQRVAGACLRRGLPGHRRSSTYRRVACDTLDYVLKEMTSPEGGLLFRHRRRFRRGGRESFSSGRRKRCARCSRQRRGGCAGSAPITTSPPPATGSTRMCSTRHTARRSVAKDLGVTAEELQETIERAKPKLYAARARIGSRPGSMTRSSPPGTA
jgi:uncharacterized protein YyaL (SSP411 family)